MLHCVAAANIIAAKITQGNGLRRVENPLKDAEEALKWYKTSSDVKLKQFIDQTVGAGGEMFHRQGLYEVFQQVLKFCLAEIGAE